MILRALCLAAGASLLTCGAPQATPTPEEAGSVFFLVRHAEKVDESEDPPLTDAGRLWAARLAHALRDADIEAIYSSDFARTRDTAAPLARELDLQVTLYDPDALPGLATTLLATPKRALIVGHSDTTPELVGLLGGEPGPPISRDEYDRLYLLHRDPVSPTTTILLRLDPPTAVSDAP